MSRTALGSAVFISLLFLIIPSTAEIKSITITSDTRPVILLEKFGFTQNGHVAILVWNVTVAGSAESSHSHPWRQGFFLLNPESVPQMIIEINENPTLCILDSRFINLLFTFHNFSDSLPHANFSYSITSPKEYGIYFANCVPQTSISMNIHAQFFNIDPNGHRNYLSVGQTNLPSLFFLFSAPYFAFLFFCLYRFSKLSFPRIHLLMPSLLLIKALNLISAAELKRFLKFTGTPHGWDVIFYVFQFLRVVLFFVVVVSLVTGWSFFKGMKVLLIVIPLQVGANVAYAVVSKTGPFIKDWVLWNQVFLLLDFLSGFVVVLLVVWSIILLRKTSKIDGNLDKLSLMKWFCVCVIGYFFFTCFLVFVLRTLVSYKYQWVSNLAEETVTLAFYVFMFYMFRRVEKNEYRVIKEKEAKIAVKE